MILKCKILTEKQAGSVLIVIIASMVIVAVLGAAMFSLFSSSTYTELFMNNRTKAYYLAQSGRNYTTKVIYDVGPNTAIAQLDGKEISVSNGNSFYLRLTKDESRTYAESTGIANKGTALEAKQKIKFTVESVRFSKEVFGVESITISSRALIDSFDSRVGYYSDLTKGQDALVQTKLTTANAIQVYKGGTIYGNAVCGVGCGETPNPPITETIKIYGTLTGTRSAANRAPVVDIVEIPEGGEIYPPPPASPRITVSTTLGVAGEEKLYRTGEIYFTKSPAKTLTIQGKVTLVIDDAYEVTNPGNVSMDSGKIVLAEGAELLMYVKRTLTLLGNSVINPPCASFPYTCSSPSPATALRILGINTTNLNFSGASETWGGVNAPGATFALASESQLYGTIVARTISLSGAKDGCALHVDKSFSSTGGGAAVGSNIVY